MKKKIYILLLFFFLNQCKSNNELIIKYENKVAKKSMVKSRSFTGKIEDFEGELLYWRYKGYGGSIANLYSLKDGNRNKIGVFDFTVGYSREAYPHNICIIKYVRKMNLKRFKGIKFLAKSDSNLIYKIKIYEVEKYYPGKSVEEVWYTTFKPENQWKKFYILFKNMQVEEYWEQDYVSDNIQNFSNVSKIAFSVQNNLFNEPVKSRLYLDEIELY